MLKHIMMMIVLTVLVILGMPYVPHGGNILLGPYHFALNNLEGIFSQGEVGDILHKSIAMLCMPVIVSYIPALFYWLMNRRFPVCFFISLTWALWLLQTGAILS